MYVEDKTLNAFVLADDEKIEKGCKNEKNFFVVFTNRRILSGRWFDGLPSFSSIPYSAIVKWYTGCEKDGINIILYLPPDDEKRYFFETSLGGEIDSILASHVLK